MPMSYGGRAGTAPAGSFNQPQQPGAGAAAMPPAGPPPGMMGYHGPMGDGTGHEMMVFMHGPHGASEGFTQFLRDLMARGKARDKMQYNPAMGNLMRRIS